MFDRKSAGKTKSERREGKRGANQRQVALPSDALGMTQTPIRRAPKPLEALTETQAAYINAIDVYPLVFCKGPAGTGKTYVPAAMAAAAFEAREIRKIIITRPAVAAEEEYGFFPGTLQEKVAPWAKPVVAILIERLGAGAVEYMLAAEQIEIAPLGMLRGHTFKDAFIMFDEAQNATPNQMKLFLTRIGENVRVVVDGDPFGQLDLFDRQGRQLPSGFDDAWGRMMGHEQVGYVEFTMADCVRSGLCRDILERYQKGATVGQAELGNFLSRG